MMAVMERSNCDNNYNDNNVLVIADCDPRRKYQK